MDLALTPNYPDRKNDEGHFAVKCHIRLRDTIRVGVPRVLRSTETADVRIELKSSAKRKTN